MTVSELIEELSKFPGHHRVFIEHPDFSAEVRHDGFAVEIASIVDVRGEDSCSVILDATSGVQ